MNDAREGRKAKTKTEFSKKDMKVLLDHAEHILEIPSQNMANAWRAWAQDYDVSIDFDKLQSSMVPVTML